MTKKFIIFLVIIIIIILAIYNSTRNNIENFYNNRTIKKGYIITIPRSYKQRKNNVDKLQVFCNNFPFGKKILGVDGKNIKDREYIKNKYFSPNITSLDKVLFKKRNYNYKRNLRISEIGVFLSHIKIYEDIVKNSYDYSIIFEDDCNIINPKKFYKHINYALSKSPKDFHYISLFLHPKQKYSSSQYYNNNYNSVGTNTWGTVCYIISLEGAKYFLKNLIPIKGPIDYKIGRINKNNKNLIYKNYSVILSDQLTFNN